MWNIEIKTDHPILARRPDLVLINKKKRIFSFIVDFVDHKVKLTGGEKLDLATEFKVTVIPIVIGIFETVSTTLERRLKELEIQRETKNIQTTAQFKLARILRRVQETWGDLLSLNLEWKNSS